MAIDITTETPLSLTEAAATIPKLDGKRPCVSTIWRWCRKGIRGIPLEYARLGHRVVTSREALARFADRLVEADAQRDEKRSAGAKCHAVAPKPRTSKQRARDIAAAEKRLSTAGV